MRCGIVGLPNVGKSTLFNALTRSFSAQAANYPFCTIEPNVGIATVYDERLKNLAATANSQKIINSCIEFVDIAGLVKGASQGEGLGNKFLGNIRNVSVIVHMVRCFNDTNITHVHGQINPEYDIEIINTELQLADLEAIQKKIIDIEKKARITKNSEILEDLAILNRCQTLLLEGKPICVEFNEITNPGLKKFGLITSKPVLYVANVSEKDILHGNTWSDKILSRYGSQNFALVSANLEESIANISDENEYNEYLTQYGLKVSSLSKIAQICQNLLDLQTFYTIGPKEARSWQFKTGSLAPSAAGLIHSDFERGFIKVEVISYENYMQYGENGSKSNGKMRLEGKDYVMRDGDVVHFKFNV